MNVKLTEVVSDVSGLTGMAIIRAILNGERNPLQLAKLRNVNCKRTQAEIARALYGNWRAEHLFALQQAVTLYDCYREQLRVCDEQMQTYLATFVDQSQGRPRPRRHGRGRRERRRNDPAFDVAGALYRMSGVDLTVLEAIDPNTALVLLSEIGPDVSRFPTVKHFCSWLGLSPQHQLSAGKIRKRRVQRGGPGHDRESIPRISNTDRFRQDAAALARSQPYRRGPEEMGYHDPGLDKVRVEVVLA